jgi:hypothetical protein
MNWTRTLLDYDRRPGALLSDLCGKGCRDFSADLTQAFRDQMDKVEHNLKFSLDPSQIKMFSEFFENIQCKPSLSKRRCRLLRTR